MVRIRLQRRGRRKKPFYHIVIADSRSPRDGRFIEKIGTYNPMTKPAIIELDNELAFDWLLKGAQPTDTVRAILRVKGVMYRKHLHRGVLKGALTQEQADEKLAAWIEKKESTFAERASQTKREQEELRRQVAGTKPKIEVPEPEPEEEAPAPTDVITEAAEVEATKTADQSVTQDPPAEEAPAPAPSEEKVEQIVEEAVAPAAVNAEAEADAAEADVQSAVDQAVDAAEQKAEDQAPADSEATAEEPAAAGEDDKSAKA